MTLMGAAFMLFNGYTKRSHSMLLSYNFKTAPFTTHDFKQSNRSALVSPSFCNKMLK